MQENPFKHPQSPILHLYARSRQKSQQNRAITRSRSSSFQNFKVKSIRTALDKQHIIQKTQNNEKERQITRERQLSKYYGIECLRYGQCISRVQTQQKELARQKREAVKKQGQRRRSSDRMSSLLNIKAAYLSGVNGQRAMSYQSNYIINQQSTYDIDQSYHRSTQKRISIASSIQNNPYQESNYYKKSRFVGAKKNKVDEVRQEYFDKDYLCGRNENILNKNMWRVI